jgi:hypothetical protein
VTDWKTSFNVPSESSYEGLFQMRAYALLVLLGRPRDGLPPLGEGVQFVQTRQGFPRYLSDDGELRYRSTVLSRQEIMDWRFDVERLATDLLERLETDEAAERSVKEDAESGNHRAVRIAEWPATPGSHCSQCSAPMECPLPAKLRDYAGTVNTAEQASLALASADRASAVVSAMRREVRNWAKRNGAVRYGDFEYAWRETVKHDPVDWDGLEEALFEAQTFGRPFSREEFVRERVGQSFSKRKLEPEELQEANADGERDAGERFGDTPPF